jgi:hypothetical protein
MHSFGSETYHMIKTGKLGPLTKKEKGEKEALLQELEEAELLYLEKVKNLNDIKSRVKSISKKDFTFDEEEKDIEEVFTIINNLKKQIKNLEYYECTKNHDEKLEFIKENYKRKMKKYEVVKRLYDNDAHLLYNEAKTKCRHQSIEQLTKLLPPDNETDNTNHNNHESYNYYLKIVNLENQLNDELKKDDSNGSRVKEFRDEIGILLAKKIQYQNDYEDFFHRYDLKYFDSNDKYYNYIQFFSNN